MAEKEPKFYQKSRRERLATLVAQQLLTAEEAELLWQNPPLDETVADNMVENQISQFSLPMGVALHFLVDERERVVPMVTEEPSVIAACSNGAKIIRQSGGFHTAITERLMVGQIILQNLPDIFAAEKIVKEREADILASANVAHPSIVQRGGGLKRIETRVIANEQSEPEFLTIHLLVDVQEAMGANILNTILEAVGTEIHDWLGGDLLMQILSNYGAASLVTATCEIKPVYLLTKNYSGKEVARRIEQATHYAKLDPYRAATHNKGIMNGIDAVVLASGNDTRAIEAGAHAYASRDGQYRAMSNWFVNEAGNLVGELTLPMPVGSVGGAISVMPLAKINQQMMGINHAKELASVIVSVGLAQNFSALRALVTEGIQKGHMSLQAKSLAIAAGAKPDEIEEVVKQLKIAPHMNLMTAKEILKKIAGN